MCSNSTTPASKELKKICYVRNTVVCIFKNMRIKRLMNVLKYKKLQKNSSAFNNYSFLT